MQPKTTRDEFQRLIQKGLAMDLLQCCRGFSTWQVEERQESDVRVGSAEQTWEEFQQALDWDDYHGQQKCLLEALEAFCEWRPFPWTPCCHVLQPITTADRAGEG